MSTIEITPRDRLDAVVAAATAGDESAFSELVHRYHRELRAHCYRMLGSYEDSEDLTQETFLRAWNKRATFRGSSFRAWLYRIATNACLSALDRRARRRQIDHATDAWNHPGPDALLNGIETTDAGPDAEVTAKETLELAFLVAIQSLPPRQRGVLFLCDVLGWPAKDTAALLETSVASVTSAQQRARATLRKRLPERRLDWAPESEPGEEERALLERCLDAVEHADAKAFAAMLPERPGAAERHG
jgi:RNA polymerase sigma-70 factor (ECF subfamily)